jgi:hypothetical protein
MKNIQIHYNYLIGAMAALIVAILTGQGTIQQYIHFAGMANEMGFFFLSLFLSSSLFFYSFSKTSK